MSRSGPNGVVIGALALILVGTLYNAIQINNTEQLGIDNQKKLDEILKNGVRTSGQAGSGGSFSGEMVNNASLMGEGCLTDQAKADQADPTNILSKPSQCRAKGDYVRGGARPDRYNWRLLAFRWFPVIALNVTKQVQLPGRPVALS